MSIALLEGLRNRGEGNYFVAAIERLRDELIGLRSLAVYAEPPGYVWFEYPDIPPMAPASLPIEARLDNAIERVDWIVAHNERLIQAELFELQ